MADATLPWNEAKAYLHDIAVLLESDDQEKRVLTATAALRAELAAAMLTRETDARKIIAEITARGARAHTQTHELAPAIEEVRARVDALESRRQALLEELTRMRSEKDTSTASLHSLTQQMAALKHAHTQLSADHSQTVPQVKCVLGVHSPVPSQRVSVRTASCRHSLSLYAAITGVKWDYDAPAHAVQGFVAPEGGALRPFYLDARMLGSVAVADRLWATIADAHGVAL